MELENDLSETVDQALLTASTKIALESLQTFPSNSVPGEFQKQPLVGDTVESLCEIQIHRPLDCKPLSRDWPIS